MWWKPLTPAVSGSLQMKSDTVVDSFVGPDDFEPKWKIELQMGAGSRKWTFSSSVREEKSVKMSMDKELDALHSRNYSMFGGSLPTSHLLKLKVSMSILILCQIDVICIKWDIIICFQAQPQLNLKPTKKTFIKYRSVWYGMVLDQEMAPFQKAHISIR